MLVQIYSDLHLELHKSYPKIKSKCDYLILAGDIGKIDDKNGVYKDFMDYCSKNWKKIVVILGNHEFYDNQRTFYKLLESYKLFFMDYENICLLEKETIKIED
jgi:predicted phosphodiesterase